MEMKRAVIVIAAALLAAVLFAVKLRAQTAAKPPEPSMVPYGQLAGCSEKPAEFHPCAIEKAKTFNPPRMPDGTPDFRGNWARSRVSTDDLEEHLSLYLRDDPGGVTMIVDPPDGKVPYQPWAAAVKATHRPKYRDPQSSCFLPSPPRQAYGPMGYQILQAPGSVSFLQEQSHAYRFIPTDGRPHIPPGILLGFGDSRGHWEGNTLVVDVTNLRSQNWFDHAGNFYSPNVHIVERWTMIAPDAIHYTATLTDPKVYTRPWTIAIPVRRNADPNYELMESACIEGARIEFTDLGLKSFPYHGEKIP
jgi:hypothetical protein